MPLEPEFDPVVWFIGLIRQFSFLIIFLAVLVPLLYLLFPNSAFSRFLDGLSKTPLYQAFVPDTNIEVVSKACPRFLPDGTSCDRTTGILLGKQDIQGVVLECVRTSRLGNPMCSVGRAQVLLDSRPWVLFFAFSFLAFAAYVLSSLRSFLGMFGLRPFDSTLRFADVTHRYGTGPLKALFFLMIMVYAGDTFTSHDPSFTYRVPNLEYLMLITGLTLLLSLLPLLVRPRAKGDSEPPASEAGASSVSV